MDTGSCRDLIDSFHSWPYSDDYELVVDAEPWIDYNTQGGGYLDSLSGDQKDNFIGEARTSHMSIRNIKEDPDHGWAVIDAYSCSFAIPLDAEDVEFGFVPL